MSDVHPGDSIDELLDRAVDAVNRGELGVARELAEEVLATDAANPEATLLSSASPTPPGGQLRRLTLMFCDLVGSTALSARHDPEQYRQIIHRYKQACQQIVEGTYDGHVAKVKGDGLLVLFGHPSAHEDDVPRAVRAALDVVAAVRRLSEQAERDLGESLAARLAVHRGLVYLDTEEDDVYGLAANVAARLQELAPPASVVVSEEVLALLGDRFEARAQEPEKVKGLDEPLASWRVVQERPASGSSAHRWTTPLVARDEPLGELREAWGSRPGAVHLRGEAGVGKSRLVGALAAEVVLADHARVVEIAASPEHADAGFFPMRVLVEQRSGMLRRERGSERLHRLRRHLVDLGLEPDRLVPLLAPVLGIDPEAGYADHAADARKLLADIAAALDRYLRAVLGDGPTLLVVEDAQWMDGSTTGLLSDVLRSLPGGLLVVITGRDAAPPAGAAVTVIDLAPLSGADSRVLAAALDPDGVTVDDLDQLVARSDGVPLYLEHLVRTAIDALPNGEAKVPDHVRAGRVPDALYEPLLARLGANTWGLAVAGAAATIGREVDPALLAQVVDLAEAELSRVVAALVDGSVLDAPAEPDGPYRFRHELLREVAYELQPPSARRQAHGRVADALATVAAGGGAPDWLKLAGHYEQAERHEAALDCYRRSAEQARRRGALVEARADLDRAVDLLWDLPETPQRADSEVGLRLRRGFLAVSAEGNASPAAATDYQRCLDLATNGRSTDAMFTTLVALWGHYASRADLARARQVLETLRAVLAGGREWSLPENEAGFGMLDWFAGRFPDSHDQLERAAAAAEARGSDAPLLADWFLPNDPRTAIHTHLGLARFMRGDPAGAERCFAAADRVAAELPFPQGPFSEAYNLTYVSWVRIQMGEYAGAEQASDRMQTLADRHGFDFWSLAAATQRAELMASRARLAEPPDMAALTASADLLAGLVSGWQLIDTRVFLPAVLTTWAATLGAAGDGRAAGERCGEALALAADTGSRFCIAETMRVRALLATDPLDTNQGLREALAIAVDQGALPFQLRIARDLYLRRADGARPALLDALALFPTDASYPELDAARALVP